MSEAAHLVLKFGLLGNAVFMLIWLGFRIVHHHPAGWIVLDATIVVGSVIVAELLRAAEDDY
jgi:hypothetical protein